LFYCNVRDVLKAQQNTTTESSLVEEPKENGNYGMYKFVFLVKLIKKLFILYNECITINLHEYMKEVLKNNLMKIRPLWTISHQI
jgi:hypothetical protein